VRVTGRSFPRLNGELLRKVHVNLPFPMLAKNLDAVLELGLQPEIYFNGDTLDHLSPAEVERTSAALAAQKIPATFHGPFMDLNPGAVDERVREVTFFRLNQVLDLAAAFHPKAIVFHPGYDRWRYDDDVDLWLRKSLLTWTPLVKRAEALSVKIALENVFDQDPTALGRLLARVDSPFLGYCMDVGHGHLFSRVPLPEWIEALGPHLFEIHLHDNHGQADEHLPPGRGSIDFPGVFSRITAKGLHPIYTIEPHEFEYLLPSLEAVGKFLG
jgi:sugar phosphate isomerase/epimerase